MGIFIECGEKAVLDLLPAPKKLKILLLFLMENLIETELNTFQLQDFVGIFIPL